MFTAGRRRRRPPLLIGVILLGLLAGPALWSQMERGGGQAAAVATNDVAAPQERARSAVAAAEAPPAAGTAAFAQIGAVDLHLPATGTILVAYHEASRPEALSLHPRGRLTTNHNATKFEDPGGADGPDYVVMSSRGRVQSATSAVDLLVRDDTTVKSPVTGTVTDVRSYRLYGQHRDWRIEIRPETDPSRRVVLIHIDDVAVSPGEEVTAGATPLAGTAKRFPFSSHVDRFTEPDRFPHVHLEVKDAGDAPIPR